MKKIDLVGIISYIVGIIVFIIFLIVSGDTFIMDNFVGGLLGTLLFPIILFFPLYCFILFSHLGNKSASKNFLSKIDFSKNKDYYRDIIGKYSPVELSYIDDFKIEKKDVIASLLSLELKKKIKLEDDKIVIINNEIDGLNQVEQFIFKNINNGLISINDNELKDIVINNSLSNNLIIKLSKKDILKRLLPVIIFLCLIIISINIGDKYPDNILFDFIYAITDLFGKLLVVFNIGFIIGYVLYRENTYKRTSLGEDINVKLEGLKVFLKDFSDLSNKSHDELIIWEDYMIYSAIFNTNKDIMNRYSRLINIIKKDK